MDAAGVHLNDSCLQIFPLTNAIKLTTISVDDNLRSYYTIIDNRSVEVWSNFHKYVVLTLRQQSAE